MALSDLTDRQAVLQAMAEADDIGEPKFLEKYGFGESRRYRIANKDRTYPSKAVLAAAHGFQFPELGALSNTEFSGGTPTTTKARELGFEIRIVGDELGIALARFMVLFSEITGQKVSHEHPAYPAIKEAARRIESLLPPRLLGAIVRPSIGQGKLGKRTLDCRTPSGSHQDDPTRRLSSPPLSPGHGKRRGHHCAGSDHPKGTLGRPQAYERLENSRQCTPSRAHLAEGSRIPRRQRL